MPAGLAQEPAPVLRAAMLAMRVMLLVAAPVTLAMLLVAAAVTLATPVAGGVMVAILVAAVAEAAEKAVDRAAGLTKRNPSNVLSQAVSEDAA